MIMNVMAPAILILAATLLGFSAGWFFKYPNGRTNPVSLIFIAAAIGCLWVMTMLKGR